MFDGVFGFLNKKFRNETFFQEFFGEKLVPVAFVVEYKFLAKIFNFTGIIWLKEKYANCLPKYFSNKERQNYWNNPVAICYTHKGTNLFF